MHVLFMISKNDRYGAQRIFLDQVAAVRDQGHDVTVVTRGTEGFVTDSAKALKVPVHGIAMKGLSDILYLRRLVLRDAIDVIHSTLDRADHVGLLLGMITRRPVFSTMMVPRCHPGFRFMDRIAVLSRMQQRLLERKGISPRKISLIRPGIDVQRFTHPDTAEQGAWRARLESDRFSLRFCHISSMLPRKAHSVSIDLAAACKKAGERPLLVIIGDPVTGEYHRSLLDHARAAGVEENVRFTGWTADIPEILSLCHFSVLPSVNEALGVVLMEGMAAGTPVIARAGEGGAELIDDHQAGFVYRPEAGVRDLAKDIIELHRDRARYTALSDHCRRTAREQFSMEAFGRKLISFYDGGVHS